jgi:uncharacterized membrane protein YphA (DoxX/SURF4 family)
MHMADQEEGINGNLRMRIIGIGHILFGASVAGLAVLCLAYGSFAPALDPIPASFPASEFWEYGSAISLLAASVGLFFARTALVSAAVIAFFEFVWLVVRARPVFSEPLSVGSWYGVAEALGPLAAVWILVSLRRRLDASPPTRMSGDRALRAARVLFGAACVVYGAAHFAYAAYTASMVPSWLPGPMVVVYLTGAAHAAAGFGLILGILPRLAATLEAIMMILFGVLVWLPSFFAHPAPKWGASAQTRFSEIFINFLLAGSAWIVAESLRRRTDGLGPAASVAPVK